MIPTFENGGLQVLFTLIGLALAAFFFAKWRDAVNHQRRRREYELAERKRQQLIDQQLNIGNRLYNVCCEACLKNPLADRLVAGRIKNNGGAYSIVVGWKENSSFTLGGPDYRGYSVVHINIDLANPPITVSYGSYPNPKHGTCVEYGVDERQICSLASEVGRYLASYSPYART